MSRGIAAACGLLLLAAQPMDVVEAEVPRGLVLDAGEASTAVLGLRIREGFKVQANPAADEYLVPLTLELTASGGVRLARVDYPEPRRHRLRGASSDLLIYEGEVELGLELEAEPDAGGVAVLEGTLRYQACDARICLRPVSLPVRFEVEVAGS